MLRALLMGLACSTAACVGTIVEAGGEGEGLGHEVDPGVVPAGAGDPNTDPVMNGDDPVVNVDDCVVDRVGIRRLNKREYANTLHDLLGVDVAMAAPLPESPLKGGFDTNASVLKTTPEHYESFLAIAERAVEEALSERSSEFLSCVPAANVFGDACVAQTLERFASRAYRGALENDDRVELEQAHAASVAAGATFEQSMAWVFEAVLTSPRFLYRSIVPAATDPNAARPIDAYELASRLSYFLWSSEPDQALLDLASQGTLADPTILEQQVTRMLADDRANELARAFTTQWLDLSGLPNKVFDPVVFPEMTPLLLGAMLDETSAFVHDALTSNARPNLLVTADYSFVSPELSSIYGVDAQQGSALDRTQLPSTQRRGLLTQASVLASTSHPNRTSIPHRGMWVMENLLCLAPPPPPPANVDTSAVATANPELTQRERLAMHRTNPACATCHVQMDDLGFGLEHYDASGAFRELESGKAIDSRGLLPDGRPFANAIELSSLLASDDTFTRCLTTNLLSYSVGRLPSKHDDCAVDEIAAAVSTGNLGMADLIARLVASEPFQLEGAEVSP